MNILKKIFSKNASKEEKPQKKEFEWTHLKNEKQLKKILQNEKFNIIFKHSMRCSISRNALKFFEKQNKIFQKQIDFYYLDLLKYRELSQKVAKFTKITHQSPQIILIKDSEILYHCSHESILEINLKKYL